MLTSIQIIYSKLFIFSFYLVIISILFGLILGSYENIIIFDSVGFVEFIALILFTFCIVLALTKQRNISYLLPFVYIAFPSNINNFIPGIYLESESLKVIYPFFNHIEIYLLICIFYYTKGSIKPKVTLLLVSIILTFIFSTIYNIFSSPDIQCICLLISGMYPIRILIYSIILVEYITIKPNGLIWGLVFSIIFLILEASVTTILSHSPELTSASLGINTFGNVLAQMSCLLLFYYSFIKKNKIFLIISGLGFLATFFTGTRMAMLSAIVVLLFIIYPKLSRTIKIWIIIFVSIGIILLFKIGVELSEKFDLNAIWEAIDFSSNQIEINRNEATTSIITRLELWKASILMFTHNLLTGIGWNLFNILKYNYGFQIIVIIDSHNDYLSFISQLGIWGMLWIYLLYIKPWLIFRNDNSNCFRCLLIFNLGMSICGFTNAGSYKFGILSTMILFSLLNYQGLKSISSIQKR